MTAKETLIEMITQPQKHNVDFWVLLDNIVWIERLTDDMLDNINSRDDSICENVLEDIQETL